MPFAIRAILLLIGFAVLLAGCDWVRIEPGAERVRVLAIDQAATACTRLGEIEVSVKASVGPYERNNLSVRDELETLARNEALTLHADAVQPLAEPASGRQRWQALRCVAR